MAFIPPVPSHWTLFVELFSAAARHRRLARIAQKKSALEAQAAAEMGRLMTLWGAQCERLESARRAELAAHRRRYDSWIQRKTAFETNQKQGNESIDLLKRRYEARDPDAIEQHCELVLSASQYPDTFPQAFSVDYRGESNY